MRAMGWAAAALVCVGSAGVRADVAYYNLFRAQRFQQPSAAVPQTPSSYDCELRVDNSDQTTMTGGSVTWSSALSPGAFSYYGPVAPVDGESATEYAWQWASASFSNQADLDVACPTESYSFSISGGSAGSVSATLGAAAYAYTDSVPALDADSWSAVQSLDPTQATTLSSVAHDPVDGTQFSGSWIYLYAAGSSTALLGNFAAGGAVSLPIPAGTLSPGTGYQVFIFFSDRVLTAGAGFGSATADSSFDRSVEIDFTTAGQVFDYNLYKVEHYLQTAAPPPSAPVFYYCNLGLDDDSAADFSLGTVTWSTTSGESPQTLTVSGTGADSVDYWWPGPEVETKRELDAYCPQTSYLYALSGGALGTVSASLTVPSDAYSAQVPAVDPATYAALTTLNPQSAVTVSTVAHPAGAGTQYSATYLSVIDAISSATIAASQNTDGADAGAAMLLLASGALLPAHSYKVSIDFTDRVITPDAGFGTATAFVAFEQSTEFDFQTLLADGGTPGAGEDAGSGDAGSTTDAGSSADAGPSDAGSTTDAGSGDAGSTTDAGSGDAGSPADAGSGDAGSHSDAGTEQDAGIGQSHSNDSGGCGCSSVSRSTGSFSNLVFCGALVAWLWRRRRAHR